MADVTPTPVAFLDPASRRRAVRLAFPLVAGGREIREVYIRRPTVAEIAAWADSAGAVALSFYEAEDGSPIPDDVLSGFDPDDNEEVARTAQDFLPRRLSRALFGDGSQAETPPASPPSTGGSTAPSSGA